MAKNLASLPVVPLELPKSITLDEFQDRIHRGYYLTTFPYGKNGSEERKTYHADNARLYCEFRDEIAMVYGTDCLPQPVRDMIFSKAWSDGHSGGYGDVESHHDDFAEVALASFAAGAARVPAPGVVERKARSLLNSLLSNHILDGRGLVPVDADVYVAARRIVEEPR